MTDHHSNLQPDIIYTKVDEAPELASGSFLPIIQSFSKVAGIDVGTKDISLAGRIISQFPEKLSDAQKQPDDLALLGDPERACARRILETLVRRAYRRPATRADIGSGPDR